MLNLNFNPNLNNQTTFIPLIKPAVTNQASALNQANLNDKSSSLPISSQNHISNLNNDLNLFAGIAKNIKNCDKFKEKLPSSLYLKLLYCLFTISQSYKKSLECMQLSANVAQKQFIPLYLSTFFVSEIQKMQKEAPDQWDNLKDYYKSPNTHLTLLFLIKFLQSKNESDFQEKIFTKLILQCANLFFMLKTAVYLTQHEKLIHSVIKTYIKNLIQELKPMQSIAFPGGWLNSVEKGVQGHFMIYMLQREDESTLIKTRINSHPILDTKESSDSTQQIITTEKLEEKQLDQFISEITDLLFKQSFLDKISAMADDKREKQLYNIGMHPKKVESDPLMNHISLEPQGEAFNCCFMACFALYQYINIKYTSHEELKPQTGDKRNQDFLLFRDEFRNYLRYEFSKNHVAVEKIFKEDF